MNRIYKFVNFTFSKSHYPATVKIRISGSAWK